MANRTEAVGCLKFRVVTTMNAAGWLGLGAKMAQSVIRNWPSECLPLVIYAEDFDPPPTEGIEIRRLPAWLDEFKARWGKAPAYNGHRAGGYDYRFDAIKFAHKVAALTGFGQEMTADDILIWLDADTFTHSTVTTEWLEALIPERAYIAWLDRMRSHPECGFVMFRCSHPFHANFMEAFRNLYTTGDLFKLRETHDSFALQHLVTLKAATGKIPQPASLSGQGFRTSHPFANGPIGACLDHCKGPLRKANGSSYRRDLVIPRDHPYWNTTR
jgi:hypothetical protein